MKNKIWNCPVCEYKTTENDLREVHVHKELDRKYDELEKLSTDIFREKVNRRMEGVFRDNSENSQSIFSGYKNLVSFYKSI